MSKGFYIKTKKGNVAHVLADENMPEETLNAIEKMIDTAYHRKICKYCGGEGWIYAKNGNVRKCKHC